ncbi:MAG: hypothetical protein ABI763_04215 [Bacteroidota bacterium]
MKNYFSFIFLFISCFANAQSPIFNLQLNIPVTENTVPLQNPWAGGINFALWSNIDLDGDGIQDLLLYDRSNYHISTFINSGAGEKLLAVSSLSLDKRRTREVDIHTLLAGIYIIRITSRHHSETKQLVIIH